jgi:hypothetical protein
MDKSKQTLLVKALYLKVRILFWASIFGFSIFTLLHYVDLSSPIMGGDMEFTVRGDVGLIPEKWEPLPNEQVLSTNSQSQLESVVLLRESAFVRLDYNKSNWRSGFTARNALITLLSIASLWIWAFFLFQLMAILKNFKVGQFFDKSNVKRLRIAGLIFFIFPLLVRAKNILFAQVVSGELRLEGYQISSGEGLWIFPKLVNVDVIQGFLAMLFIIIIANVFGYGTALKSENDLTV